MRVLEALFCVVLFSGGCGSHAGSVAPPRSSLVGRVFTGKAVYYSSSYNGRKTASGEIYNETKMTAAHRTLPFGTIVRVTNLANGKSVVVRINDRGPFGRKERIIDLSLAAARKLEMVKAGVVNVRIEVIR